MLVGNLALAALRSADQVHKVVDFESSTSDFPPNFLIGCSSRIVYTLTLNCWDGEGDSQLLGSKVTKSSILECMKGEAKSWLCLFHASALYITKA
ncbi:cyclin H [Prunus dulcis]|uniref:Cyclin H n=1 Tax=Prunus dulcis TaxID=3755 RepID=A0A4Y1RPH5_PRUDU|nr:cyclin H [Prunus dulcis]